MNYDFKRLLVESGIIPREAARLYEKWGALEKGTADGAGEIIFDRPTKEEMEEAFVEFGDELGRLLRHRPAPPPGAENVNPDNRPILLLESSNQGPQPGVEVIRRESLNELQDARERG